MTDQQQKAIAPFAQDGDRCNQTNLSSNSSQSKQFQRSGKEHPCPICGRTKDLDCAWNDEIKLCHTYIDQDARVPGYVHRGVDKTGMWGQYFPESRPVAKPIRPKATQHYVYHDAARNPLVRVSRKDDGNGKKQIWQSHWDGQNWVKGGITPAVKAKLRLYRIGDEVNQQAIANGDPIFIVEGEGKVDLLVGMGMAATCAIGGAGKWQHYGYPNYLEDLKGANVLLCPDRDRPGVKHCLEIEQDFPNAQWLYVFPDSPEWDNLPAKQGLDIADWIAQGKPTVSEILAAIAPKRPGLLESPEPQDDEAEPGEPEKKTIAQLLLAIANQGDYFHTSAGKAYVDIRVDHVRQTVPVKSKRFKQWLQYELYSQHGKAPGSETLHQVLGLLEAKAGFEGETQDVHLRIAEQDGKLYLDLGTDDWSAVEISESGWKIVTDYPVRFRRTDSLLPLPIPQAGGELAELQALLNIDDDGWIVVISWLLFSLYPKYSHPLLIFHGQQGAGKSFTAKLLKSFVDPGKAPLIPNVANLQNLAIQAENRWVMVYDNLSHLSADQSDALCRISTGGGFSTRTLYENDEETVFEFIRPQILTGIDELASRGDLLERSLLVELSPIPAEQRLTEAELEAKLAQCSGRILGALLTALSQTLQQLPLVKSERLPRMADFARFAIAAETALGLPAGSFMRVYDSNRQSAHVTAVESSPVAVAIVRFMASRDAWQGIASDLLDELNQRIDDNTRKKRSWAGTPKALGKALTRLAPDLQGMGIAVIRSERSSNKRWIRLEKRAEQTSQTSHMSQPRQDKTSEGDISDPGNVTADESNVTSDQLEQSRERRWQLSRPESAGTAPTTNAQLVVGGLGAQVTQANCGEWVFHRGLNTQVKLLKILGATAKVEVPGMGQRVVKLDELEPAMA